MCGVQSSEACSGVTTMAGRGGTRGARAAIAGQFAVAERKGVVAGQHEPGAALAEGLLRPPIAST